MHNENRFLDTFRGHNTRPKILSLCFSSNSRIVVENCVIGICNNGMFLEFCEFGTKYLAGVYKRH